MLFLSVSQYFEYTSQKEIRFNSVTELCAEVQDGMTHIGMKHCPRDGAPRLPDIIWEFRDVSLLAHSSHYHWSAISKQDEIRDKHSYCISDLLCCCISMPNLLYLALVSFQDGSIYHPHSNMCITTYRTEEGRADIQMTSCSPGDKHQRWSFEWL